jgi:hypothetical protein
MENTNAAGVVTGKEIEEIKDLKFRYCRFADARQWESLRGLFMEDAHLIFKDVMRGKWYEFFGRDELIGLAASMLSIATTVHRVYNPDIKVLPDGAATATWSMEDDVIFPEDTVSPYQKMHGFGFYHDTLEKSGGEWRIRAMVLERVKLDFTMRQPKIAHLYSVRL